MIEQMLAVAKRLLGTRLLGAPAAVPLPPPVCRATAAEAPEAKAAPVRRGRPASPALVRTLEMLQLRPDVSAAELAPRLGVSVSYARTLLRRARERAPEHTPVLVAPIAPAAPSDTDRLDEIVSRLASAEQEIHELRSRRARPKGRLDISCRAEVIRRSLAGETSGQIAAALSVPEGEVRFILKVQRLLMKAS